MNRLFFLLYEMSLWLLAILATPKMLYYFFIHGKYRHSLWYRLGFKGFEISQEHPLIWIHAVSLGETKAVIALARELKITYPHHRLLISSVTETGHAEAKRSLPFANYHVYLPFDFYFIIKKIVRKTAPQLVIICESDFWLNFMRLTKQQGAALVLVNGKLSQKSAARFKIFNFFSKKLFSLFDLLCVQNSLYKERFVDIGVQEEKLHVTGNLKLDDEYPQLTKEGVYAWREKLGIFPEQPVLTIGSSHYPEEQMLIRMLKELWNQIPDLKAILVPRHPERFKEVVAFLEKERLKWINFTDINRRTGKEQVILIDAIGMLRMCYQLSDIAIVGGSFTLKVGGHNILEPCWYGKPVIFGLSMYSQLELVDLIKQAEAGIQVSEQELQKVLEILLIDSSIREEIGQNGLALVQSLTGSTKRTLQTITALFQKFKFPSTDVLKA
ncbi:3-deoxy-D-manno-octulosonic acid transferase [Candidatus Protochlamydia amoebophila]|uniref:3-deoxy-D-manno-octulosonic acid transferase n=1 Tax=Candidatus Protochlamydia amoebophila TaxID=362787 RepID=UPI001BC964E5|nr:3-deoxy-D-manno-octulosonic acid transferase [Candidatus Protochlamydia amoebophila]